MKDTPLVYCFCQRWGYPLPCTAVSYLFTYLLPDGYPITTRTGTRETNYPITAAL